MNYQEPIHKIIEATVAQSPWTELIPYMRLFYTLSQEQYFDILSEVSTDFTLWQTTYLHRMPSHQAIMDWYSSTGLRPYLDAAVSEAARDGFYQEGRDYIPFPAFLLYSSKIEKLRGTSAVSRGSLFSRQTNLSALRKRSCVSDNFYRQYYCPTQLKSPSGVC